MIYVNGIPYFAVICAWCKSICSLSTVEGSHGMCESCSKKFLNQ